MPNPFEEMTNAKVDAIHTMTDKELREEWHNREFLPRRVFDELVHEIAHRGIIPDE